MRVAFVPQLQLDCSPVLNIRLNTNCRDEIIPILTALQHIYAQPQLRDPILQRVANDVNGHTKADCGREGLTYWQILVLVAVRLGCNLNYDKLQDLAEQHRALRHIMGLGDWGTHEDFNWHRIRDNICLITPETIEQINQLIVAEGHKLAPEAAKAVRGDSFVVETDVHYPTESSLILDSLEKLLILAPQVAKELELTGWRQSGSLLRKGKKAARRINRISKQKGADYQERLRGAYKRLLGLAEHVAERAQELLDEAMSRNMTNSPLVSDLLYYHATTLHVCGTARRRVLEGGQVENCEKLFSVFEPHTELIKRGKTPNPIQFGHAVLVIEDALGFICHYRVLGRGQDERGVLIPEMRKLQARLGGRIERASFDRGFHSAENQRELAKIVRHPCLARSGAQAIDQEKTVQFRKSRQRHPGVESAIGALQSGNGLKRCCDRSDTGYARYVGLGILGRNLHILGHLILAREQPKCLAAATCRKKVA